MRALVLAGGGAKGAYEIGVWRALRKMHINVDIVTGTSIGAINGAMVVQGNYYKALRLWLTTDFYKLFGKEIKNLTNINNKIKIYSKNIMKKTGIDATHLENYLEKEINIKKFYKSKIDFGIVTFNLSTMKPTLLKKKDIEPGKLVDYIMASAACFPALDIKTIDGEKYIDGGYYDNVPINLAIDMGADSIIAVDLDAIGIRKKVKKTNIDLTYIKPNVNLGEVLVFDKKVNKYNICLGYNDTMKAFQKLDGDFFTFRKNDLKKNYKKYGKDYAYAAKRMIGINNKKILNQLLTNVFYQDLINNNFDNEKIFNESIEYLGKTFDIANYKVYDIKLFNHFLQNKFINEDDNNLRIDDLKKINIGKEIKHRHIIKVIYNYMLKPIEYHKEITELSMRYPKDFLGALYLYTII